MTLHYVEVPNVPSDVQDAAEAALRWGRQRLRIVWPVRFAFFNRASPDLASDWPWRTFVNDHEIWGCVNPREPDLIWIRGDLSPHEARRVVLHELVHVRELESPEGGLAHEWERTAEAFSIAHLALLERTLR